MTTQFYPFIVFLLFSFCLQAQSTYNFEPSAEHPFGLPNLEAPKELLDFAPLIGECNCKSIARIDKNTWADTVEMTWRFKYIMNGMAVQDETLKEDGIHSGSIRQFIPDSARWFVHYYSSGSPTGILPAWEGGKKEDGKIILYNDQKAPNGMEGDYRITFSDMTAEGFNWLGEWVNKGETFLYPTWKIYCKKTQQNSNEAAKAIIAKNAKDFSTAYVNGDYETMANTYTVDGKIFPNRSDIVEGRPALKEWWTIKNGSKILNHKTTATEVTFSGDYAYDYGYYEGRTQLKDNSIVSFKGKYLIVWKKVAEDWLMYLDIWNGMGE